MSLDEEYVACMVECVMAGSLAEVRRDKIRKILDRKAALGARLEQARRIVDGGTLFLVETERVQSVLVKLARGHVLYELNERCSEEPTHIQFQPIHLMSKEIRERFETSPDTSVQPGLSIWPEVRSRALQRLIAAGPDYERGWVIVQPGRYRYLASVGTLVRIVISEYLACEVAWLE